MCFGENANQVLPITSGMSLSIFFFLSFSFIIYKMNINDNSTLILWLWELNDGREPSTEPGLTFTIMLL